MAQPIPILGGAYTDESRPLSVQDTCNYILFPAERPGTRTEGKLVDAPGLKPFVNVGDGPIRGMRDVEGKLFVVSGSELYQVVPDGGATLHGTIPGTGLVSMTHNQIANGNQVVIGTRDNSYVWDTTTAQLTATGVGLTSVDFLNQLILGIDPGRRFWRYSGLADALSWNTLDNESAESSPDRIVGGIVSQGEWLVFGERTIEVWSHSPNSSTAFQRSTVIERGCISGATICRLDNSVIFLGNDNILYRLEGYSPRPISTSALTAEWGTKDPRKAFAFTYEDKGRVIYYLTHQDGQTFGYDVTTGEWHRRESYGFDRWRLNALVKWNGSWYGGDLANGRIYRLVWGYMFDGEDELVRYRRTGALHGNQNRVTVNSVELLLDPGIAAEVVGGFPPLPTISGDAPNGAVSQEYVGYSYTVTGDAPLVVDIASGTLPDGLAISSAGQITGTPTVAGSFSFVARVTDKYGQTATVSDTIDVVAGIIACSAQTEYEGGEAFPTQIEVILGSGVGSVALTFNALDQPDKFEVWYDGALVIDTGYRGQTSYQAELDAALAARGLPSETISTPVSGTISFTKSTATTTALVKVYGPLEGTQWFFTLACPE